MKKLFVLLLSTTLVYQAFSQDKVAAKNIFRAGLEVPLPSLKFSYEHGIRDNFSINSTVSLQTLYFGTGYSFGMDYWGFAAGLRFDAEARYYFTMHKRMRMQKNTRNFSATYISIQPGITTPPIIAMGTEDKNGYPTYFDLYVNIGLQRQLKRGFYFNTNGGIAVVSKYFPELQDYGQYNLKVGFTIGYVINSKPR